jgi:hypothetical protein
LGHYSSINTPHLSREAGSFIGQMVTCNAIKSGARLKRRTWMEIGRLSDY